MPPEGSVRVLVDGCAHHMPFWTTETAAIWTEALFKKTYLSKLPERLGFTM